MRKSPHLRKKSLTLPSKSRAAAVSECPARGAVDHSNRTVDFSSGNGKNVLAHPVLSFSSNSSSFEGTVVVGVEMASFQQLPLPSSSSSPKRGDGREREIEGGCHSYSCCNSGRSKNSQKVCRLYVNCTLWKNNCTILLIPLYLDAAAVSQCCQLYQFWKPKIDFFKVRPNG